MKNTVKLNESQLRKIVAESVKKVLKEIELGGNDWGQQYSNYMKRNKTNTSLDSGVREMHTICQYADDIYDAVYNGKRSKYFPNAKPQVLQHVLNNIQPIYGLMSNRTNIAGDEQGMTLQDMHRLIPNFQVLAKCGLSPIDSAAKRFIVFIQQNGGI